MRRISMVACVVGLIMAVPGTGGANEPWDRNGDHWAKGHPSSTGCYFPYKDYPDVCLDVAAKSITGPAFHVVRRAMVTWQRDAVNAVRVGGWTLDETAWGAEPPDPFVVELCDGSGDLELWTSPDGHRISARMWVDLGGRRLRHDVCREWGRVIGAAFSTNPHSCMSDDKDQGRPARQDLQFLRDLYAHGDEAGGP